MLTEPKEIQNRATSYARVLCIWFQMTNRERRKRLEMHFPKEELSAKAPRNEKRRVRLNPLAFSTLANVGRACWVSRAVLWNEIRWLPDEACPSRRTFPFRNYIHLKKGGGGSEKGMASTGEKKADGKQKKRHSCFHACFIHSSSLFSWEVMLSLFAVCWSKKPENVDSETRQTTGKQLKECVFPEAVSKHTIQAQERWVVVGLRSIS